MARQLFKAALVAMGMLMPVFAIAQQANPSPLTAQNVGGRGAPIIVEAPAQSAASKSQPTSVPNQNSAASTSLKFDVIRYRVEGNTLLPAKTIQRVLVSHLGKQKDFADIQHALEALQQAYQIAGYGVVQVTLPEQELEKGEILFKVIETRLGKITIQGNKHYSQKNIRNSLPALQSGKTPESTEIARDLKVANESPTKKTQVLLRAGEDEDEVDATVKVVDDNPIKYSVSLDNSGTDETGRFRLNFGFQHANLWDRDQMLTFQYITDPENPNKVKVYGAGYHVPLYQLGDSIDLVAGYSTVNSGTVQNLFVVSGAGLILLVRYNENLDRIGDYEHKLVYGFDYRDYQNNVTTVGSTVALVPGIVVHPASLTYDGTLHLPNAEFNFYISQSQNIFPGGYDDENSDFQGPSTAFPFGAREGAKAGYQLWRYGANYSRTFDDWQMRAVLTGQYTDDALVVGEQFGVGGANSVRGFEEREYSDDRGYQSNFEFYTPDIANKIGYASGHLRFLIFYDTATEARNFLQPGEQKGFSLDSTGVGLRFLTQKYFSLHADFAYVLHDGGGDAGKPDGRRGSEMLHAAAIWVF
jgi:hemolysin activation/secretion protein